MLRIAALVYTGGPWGRADTGLPQPEGLRPSGIASTEGCQGHWKP